MPVGSPYRQTARCYYLMEGDLRAISAALKSTWPRIKFVESDCVRRFNTQQHEVPPLTEIALRYYDDLSGLTKESQVDAWLEPEGWAPCWVWRWGEGWKGKYGWYALADAPRIWVRWQQSGLFEKRLDDGRRGVSMQDGRVLSTYLAFDREHAAFVRKTWRIVDKFATNQVDMVTYLRSEKRYTAPQRWSEAWIGYDTLRWLKENPLHCLNGRSFLPEQILGLPPPPNVYEPADPPPESQIYTIEPPWR